MSDSEIDSGLNIDNSFARELVDFYSLFAGDKAPSPKLIKFNRPLAKTLGLDLDNLSDEKLAAMLSGGASVKGSIPLAQAYAGHQFGGFSPQLGDGRALLLAEVLDLNQQRRDIHLKGSGRTVFSRGGDGKAVLGPILREYLLGEAMHSLNVPTTRALAVVTTGERVMRQHLLPGAVLARVASSHIRVGTFQFFAARGQSDKVKLLADYTIERHFGHLKDSPDCYLGLLGEVCDKQASLIAKWMNLGFVHGVMNTDNMTICGETIDYGPCAFIDNFDPSAVFSSIDSQSRYAYSNQPAAAIWNLSRFAETLLPLINNDTEQAVELATQVINSFEQSYQQYWLTGMRSKLGLSNQEPEDLALANELLEILAAQKVDFTQLFRALGNLLQGGGETANMLFTDPEVFQQWQQRWSARLSRDPLRSKLRVESMHMVNPVYIPRNYQVEQVITAAEENADFAPFEKLLAALTSPFEQNEDFDEFSAPPADEFGCYTTYCGT
ncbi:MAG: hypothetical protein OFPI_25920 [Osedax symbiont Rs2]|nr:MAG: hypothetical protein OFPI_25920 [Osedax symbiont Rs2]